MKRFAAFIAIGLAGLPLLASAQLPSMTNFLQKLPSAPNLVGPGNTTSQGGDSLTSGYVAANKDVLLANALMAEALGLKDAAAAARASADALTEGATKGNLEDANKAVSASTDAVRAEMDKGPTLDAAAKDKYQSGLGRLGHGLLRYVALRGPASEFSRNVRNLTPAALPRLQVGFYIVGQLPSGVSNLSASLSNATAFARSHDIPVPDDATKAMASL